MIHPVTSLCSQASSLQCRANTLAENGDLKGSLALFFEAVALCPASEVLHEAISQLQNELGEHEPALRSAARAVELAPEVPSALRTSSVSLIALLEKSCLAMHCTTLPSAVARCPHGASPCSSELRNAT